MAQNRYGILDFSKELGDKFKLSAKQSREILDWIVETIQAKTKGGSVTLRGFGRFYTHTSPARVARNPHTGGKVNVPAKTKIKFKQA
jgi:nucleoid DNA-binding protein